MGAFSQVIHVHRTSQAQTTACLTQTLRSLGYSNARSTALRGNSIAAVTSANPPAYVIGPQMGNWTPIIDVFARPWTGEVSSLLSKISRTYVLCLLVHDDDVTLYNLDRAGTAVDGYNSLPLYFETERPSDSYIESQRHTPERFQELLPDGKSLQGLVDILNTDWWAAYDAGQLDPDGVITDEDLEHSRYTFESERMTDLGSYLELAGPGIDYPFAYWQDTDEINWDGYTLIDYSKRKFWQLR